MEAVLDSKLAQRTKRGKLVENNPPCDLCRNNKRGCQSFGRSACEGCTRAHQKCSYAGRRGGKQERKGRDPTIKREVSPSKDGRKIKPKPRSTAIHSESESDERTLEGKNTRKGKTAKPMFAQNFKCVATSRCGYDFRYRCLSSASAAGSIAAALNIAGKSNSRQSQPYQLASKRKRMNDNNQPEPSKGMSTAISRSITSVTTNDIRPIPPSAHIEVVPPLRKRMQLPPPENPCDDQSDEVHKDIQRLRIHPTSSSIGVQSASPVKDQTSRLAMENGEVTMVNVHHEENPRDKQYQNHDGRISGAARGSPRRGGDDLPQILPGSADEPIGVLFPSPACISS